MMHVGDIVSAVGAFSTVEGYYLFSFEYLHCIEHPNSTHDIPSHVS